MPNLIPSTMLYGQVYALLDEMNQAVRQGQVRDAFDVIAKTEELLTNYHQSVGGPLADYEYVVSSDPPSSEKMNRFLRTVEYDIGILKRQLDVLRAASVLTYNQTSTQVHEVKANNARISNKAKSLQMYSDSYDAGIVMFSDYFSSFDFVDASKTPEEERVHFASPGYVTLKTAGSAVNLSTEAEVKILSSSSDKGLLGNNQQINDPVSAEDNPVTGEPILVFKQELYDAADLEYIQDGEPDTWVEYEAYQVIDREVVGSFLYEKVNEDGKTEGHDWSEGPEGGVLNLDLEFDLGAAKHINSILITPYGLENDSNYPVLIKRVQTSPNGTDWTNIRPTDVWVTTDINLRSARVAQQLVSNSALWAFEVRTVRYVRVFFEQRKPVEVPVGQVYWVDPESETESDKGPIPPIDDTGKYLGRESVNSLIQRRRAYRARRWAIGIRDIELNQLQYQSLSTFVTKPMRTSGRVDRVALESVDVEIPSAYPAEQHWVRFFVSPDDGENWYPIAQMQDPEEGIPQQISFNDPVHESLRETYVVNYNTEHAVRSIRMKVEMSRPDGLESTTPVLRSYTLKVRQE